MSTVHSGTNHNNANRQALLVENNSAVVAAVTAAGERYGWWKSREDWQRIYSHFTARGSKYCTLAYQTKDTPQRLCLVFIFRQEPAKDGQGATFLDRTLGWITVMPFFDDPVLTTLPNVLADYADCHVVRYRPLRRCTLKAWHKKRGEYVFVKVFADDRGRAIYEESRHLWEVRQLGRIHFQVAEAVDWSPAQRSVTLGCVVGESLATRLFSYDGIDLAKRMGKACGSLPNSGLRPCLQFSRHTQYQRSVRYANELIQYIPELADHVARFVVKLSDLNGFLPKSPLRPIHGAPHVHQWLDSGHDLGLIDFDRFCMGDAELDVATFVAEMDFEDSSQVPIQAINQAFTAEYEVQSGPLNVRLLQLYRAQKRLAKALKTARSLGADAQQRATRRFHYAVECLKEFRL